MLTVFRANSGATRTKSEGAQGLSGRMKIRIEPGGGHFYGFDYQIGETP
jgi:hypothetical protein